MLIGALMIFVPIAVFLSTLSLSGRFEPGLRATYRYVGGIVVFLGGAISVYFAMYTGDQGGIAAFFFQLAVILVYVALSILLVILNWLLGSNSSRISDADDRPG